MVKEFAVYVLILLSRFYLYFWYWFHSYRVVFVEARKFTNAGYDLKGAEFDASTSTTFGIFLMEKGCEVQCSAVKVGGVWYRAMDAVSESISANGICLMKEAKWSDDRIKAKFAMILDAAAKRHRIAVNLDA